MKEHDQFLGVEVDNIPVKCRMCPILAECALSLSDIDLTEPDWLHPFQKTAPNQIKQLFIGLSDCVGPTEEVVCGSRYEAFMRRRLESAKRIHAERRTMK